ncbi:SAM-dependent methyltransferase [Micromonospora sp. NPDC049559]|uniref:SAM-dependent methyltransferase n=1 Tax=Micromonospora sp. NPDC049559 TaxID=3155923 RepID=UPI0034127D63
MERPSWAPPEVDLYRPSPARIYDYMLGGSHNFAVDRNMAEHVLAVVPQVRLAAHANRAFLRRAVDHLAAAGIRQFIDLGSGIPTVGNVHETAQRTAPDARVVYVDHDPVAVSHSREIVAGNPLVTVVQADIRSPQAVVDDPAVRAALDFSRPVGVLMVAVLHFVLDDAEPAAITAGFMRAVVPGSYLVLSHAGALVRPASPEELAVSDHYARANPVAMRTRDEVTAFFAGLELIEPGVVEAMDWRPEPDAAPNPMMRSAAEAVPSHVGVAVKR